MVNAEGGSDLVGAFVARIGAITRETELRGLLDDVCPAMGFDYYALIHHVDLRRRSPSIVHIENYPAVWSDHFIQNGLYVDDPVIHASLRTNVGFSWSEVPRLIRMTSRQREILDQAAKEGLGCGFTIPAIIPGERTGSCSFATRRGRPLPEHNLLIAQLVGSFAFEAARRLANGGSSLLNEPPKLSRRQRECVLLVAQGKTDWEIGRILDLSEETITKYLNAARARYGVAKRIQLVVCAVMDGQISLTEIVTWR